MTLTKVDIVEQIASRCGFSKLEAAELVEGVFDAAGVRRLADHTQAYLRTLQSQTSLHQSFEKRWSGNSFVSAVTRDTRI